MSMEVRILSNMAGDSFRTWVDREGPSQRGVRFLARVNWIKLNQCRLQTTQIDVKRIPLEITYMYKTFIE